MRNQDTNPPVLMDQQAKMKIRAASFRVQRLFPTNVGKLLSRELLTWEEFGYTLGSDSLIKGAVDEILNMPLPNITPAPAAPNPPYKLQSAVGYE